MGVWTGGGEDSRAGALGCRHAEKSQLKPTKEGTKQAGASARSPMCRRAVRGKVVGTRAVSVEQGVKAEGEGAAWELNCEGAA